MSFDQEYGDQQTPTPLAGGFSDEPENDENENENGREEEKEGEGNHYSLMSDLSFGSSSFN